MSRMISAIFARLHDLAQVSADRNSDSELIARFVQANDSAALELLFWRHGPLVWSVCRRILGASDDAEDAFQATFVVLARKARTIANRGAFASWLHRVAWRTALTVRKTRSRQMSRELPFDNGCDVPQDDDPSLRLQSAEENAILDRELARLPQKYRVPLILCDMENCTREAAAAELKCPLGTLNSRLSRGRDMLRLRLQRCGVTFTGLGAVLMMPAIVSATWQGLRACPSMSVQQFADSAMRSMALASARKAFAAFALCGTLIAGTTLMALGVADPNQAQPAAKEPPKNLPTAAEEKPATASRFIDPNGDPLPEGAVARIGSNRLRHAGEVTGLRYSPDGKWLASISTHSTDATARLWDAASGKQQLLVKIKTGDRERSSPMGVCRALGFSKDGKQFFVIDMASLRAFDIDSGKELFAHVFPKTEPQGKARRPFLEDVNGAAISPDGRTYVLFQRQRSGAEAEQQLEIREVATGKVLVTPELPFKSFHINSPSPEFSPDGRHLFLLDAESDKLNLAVIEVATGKTISQIKGDEWLGSLQFVAGTDKLVGVAFESTLAPKNKGGGPTGRILDWKSGKLLRSFEAPSGTIAVAPDGKTLIADGNGQSSLVIDMETGNEIARIARTQGSNVLLAFSPDETLLAGAGFPSGAIRVWDMKTRGLHAMSADPASFYGVRFGPDSNTLELPGRGHPLIDWRSGKVLELLPELDEVRPFRFVLSPSRKWFVTSETKDHSISVIDARTGKQIRSLKGHTQFVFVRELSFSRDESRLASASDDKTIRVWDLKSGNEIAQFAAPEITQQGQVALSDDGRVMVVGFNDWTAKESGSVIVIWDVDAKKRLARLESNTRFFPLVISPNGKWLAAGGGAEKGEVRSEISVHLWETATGRMVHTLPGHSIGQRFVHGASCAFSSDSRWLATGDASGKLRIWEVISGQEVRSFIGHLSSVWPEFSPDGKLLVAASDDAPCFIWDVLNASSKPEALTGSELQDSWNDLRKSDAKKAFQAIGRLAANPDTAAELIRKNLKPAVAIDSKKLHKLLGGLCSNQFAERESATAELSKIADRIEPTLRQRLSSTSSEDEHRRLEKILKTLETPSLKRIEESRALSALEFIGNAEAIKMLDELAGGAKDDALTRAAIDARERLRKRAK